MGDTYNNETSIKLIHVPMRILEVSILIMPKDEGKNQVGIDIEHFHGIVIKQTYA